MLFSAARGHFSFFVFATIKDQGSRFSFFSKQLPPKSSGNISNVLIHLPSAFLFHFNDDSYSFLFKALAKKGKVHMVLNNHRLERGSWQTRNKFSHLGSNSSISRCISILVEAAGDGFPCSRLSFARYSGFSFAILFAPKRQRQPADYMPESTFQSRLAVSVTITKILFAIFS